MIILIIYLTLFDIIRGQIIDYAFWWQYLPFSNIEKVGNYILNSQQKFTGQLIFTTTNLTSIPLQNDLLMWLSFDYTYLNITLYQNGITYNFSQNPLLFEDNLNIGSNIYIKTDTQTTILLQLQEQVLIQPIQQLYGQIGQFNFDFFHGQYSNIEIIYNLNFQGTQLFDTYFNNIIQNRNDLNEITYNVFKGINDISQDFFSTSFSLIGYKYQMRCWVKLNYKYVTQRQRYLLLRMTLNQNYRNDTYLGDRLILMSYVLDSTINNYNLFNTSILTYTYPYPMTYVTGSSQIFTIQNTTNFQRFQQWHYIWFQFAKTNTQLNIWFPNNEFIQQQFNVNQFHNQYVYLFVGADTFFSQGFLNCKIYLDFTYNYTDIKQYQIYCHSSCLECNGPDESNCISCVTNSHRIYSYGYCVCEQSYIEQGQYCILPNNFSEGITILEQVGQSVCKYGEFQYQNNCIKCPSLITEFQITCIDCLINNNNWFDSLICSIDYKRQNLNQVYMKYERTEINQEIFYLNTYNLQLILCVGCLNQCQDITKINCIQFNNKYYTCKQGYYKENNKCMKCQNNCKICNNQNSCEKCIKFYGFNGTICEQCPLHCQTCKSKESCITCNKYYSLYNGKCYKCGQNCEICEFWYDQQRKIYINRCLKCFYPEYQEISFDSLKCQPTYITNCIYGFTYSSTFYYNNLDLYFQPQNVSSTLTTICIRCINTYSYSLISQQCYISTNPCDVFGFYSSSFQCVIGGENAIQVQSCSQKQNNCQQCVNFSTKFICVECQVGYYADHTFGGCIKCDQNCLTCASQFKKSKGLWKKNIRAFYEYYINQSESHDFLSNVESIISEDFEVICTSCNDGYELDDNNKCIQQCPSNCKQCIKQNGQNVCAYCDYNQNGVIVSTQQNQCYKCQRLCSLCISDTTVRSISSYTNKCILPISQELYFIQNIYQFQKCVNSLTCKIVLQINLNYQCDQNNAVQDLSFIFDQYYDTNFLTFMNEENVEELQLILSISNCTFQKDMIISQQFSDSIYSLSNVSLIIIGQDRTLTKLIFEGEVYFNNFHSIWFKNLKMDLPTIDNIFYFNTNQLIAGFINVIIQNNFIIYNCTELIELYLIYIELINFQANNITSQIQSLNSEINILVINTLLIDQAIIINSIFFNFQDVINLSISNIKFTNSQFQNSTILYFEQESQLIKIQLINITFYSSILIKSTMLELNQLSFQNINLNDQSYLIVSQGITINSFICNQSNFTNSSILIKISSNNDFQVNITSINLTKLIFLNNSYIANINSINSLIIKDLFYEEDFQSSDIYKLIIVSISNVLLEQSQLQYQNQITPIFYFENIEYLQINNYNIQQQNMNYVLSQYFRCVENQLTTNLYPYIKIINVYSTMIQQITVHNVILFNQPLIYQLLQSNQMLNITNSTFQNIILIKSLNNIIISQINVESQGYVQIIIYQNQFINNILQEYSDNKLQATSATLLYCQIPLGTLIIDNVVMQYNLVINSLNSNIYAWAQSIRINNSIFLNQNYYNSLFYQQLQTYTNLINDLQLQQIFQQLSYGGIAFFYLQNFTVSNCYFNYYQAFQGGAFYLTSTNKSYITFEHNQFHNGQVLLGFDESDGGTIYLNSAWTILTFIMSNTTIENSYSFNKGGVIYALISQKSILIFNKMQFINCNSLHSNFLAIEISKQLQYQYNQYVLKINSVYIKNQYSETQRFLSIIGVLSQLYLYQLQKYSPMLIDVEYGKIFIIDLVINEMIGYGIGIFSISYQFTLSNSILSNIHLNNSLLILESPIGKIEFINNKIDQIIFDYEFIVYLPLLVQNDQSYMECINEILISTQTYSFDYNNVTQNLLQDISNHFNMIDIQSCQAKIYIQQTTIFNISCLNCNIFSIETNNFVIIKQSQLFNNFGNQTILQFIGLFNQNQNNRLLSNIQNDLKKNQIYQIRIYDSLFNNNSAQLGGVIYAKEISISFYSATFINNTAYIGGVLYLENSNVILSTSQLINNNANIGGAIRSNEQLYINPLRQNIISNNQGTYNDDNIQSLPCQLGISIDRITTFKNIIVLQNSITLFQEVSTIIKLPSGIQINQYYVLMDNAYKHGDNNQLSYYSKVYEEVNLNYSFRIIAFNQYYEQQQLLNNSNCTILSKLQNETEFSTKYLSLSLIQFNETTNDYNLDSLIILTRENLTMSIQCDSIQLPIFDESNQYIIDYHNNYILYVNLTIFECQIGEILQMNKCVQCQEGTYSLKQNSVKCSNLNEINMITSTAFNIRIRKQYWRPYYSNDQVSFCYNQPQNCLGGWQVSQDSCTTGHFGALCEMCDIYNLRGQGNYFKSNGDCLECQTTNIGYLSLIFVGLWSLVSMLFSINSSLNEQQLSFLRHKFIKIGFRPKKNINETSVLLKLFLHYLQILSIINTFQLNFPNLINITSSGVGSPIKSLENSMDCLLYKYDSDLLVSRLIATQLLPFCYLIIILIIYNFILYQRKGSFKKGVFNIIMLHTFISTQPSLVGILISMISFRNISGFKWVQGDVSYRYDLNILKLIILSLPTLITITIIIPILIFINLYKNKQNMILVRNTWGYLLIGFKDKYYYWELIRLIMKNLVIIIITMFDQYIVFKGCLIFLLLYVYKIFIDIYQPYEEYLLNKIDNYGSRILQITIVLCICSNSMLQSDLLNFVYVCYIFILEINVFYWYIIFSKIYKEIVQDNYETILKVKHYCLQKFPKFSRIPFCRYLLGKQITQRNSQRYGLLKKYLISEAKSILIQRKEGILSDSKTNFIVIDFDNDQRISYQPNHQSRISLSIVAEQPGSQFIDSNNETKRMFIKNQ